MKILYPIILSLLFISACTSNSKLTEEAAVQKVLEFYGGVCNYSIELENSNEESSQYIRLEMKESDSVNKLSKYPRIVSSNVAYLFYSNLKEKKQQYPKVEVILTNSKNEKQEFTYLATELDLMQKLVPLFNSTVQLIKKNKYAELLSTFDLDENNHLTKEMLANYCTEQNSIHGKITSPPTFQGFSILNRQGMDLIRLSGLVDREKQTNPLSIIINRNAHTILRLENKF